ncbi:CinA family protein, partial [Pelagibacterales bacterium SAG-MED25]|nr:CinA family protein [Pelagibacterales bacterium SAG-MED25]
MAFAESCTGGMLASKITAISGASKVFSLGLVTYSNQA